MKKIKYKEPKSLLEVRSWKRKVSREIEKLGWDGFRKKKREKTEALMASIEQARQKRLAGKR